MVLTLVIQKNDEREYLFLLRVEQHYREAKFLLISLYILDVSGVQFLFTLSNHFLKITCMCMKAKIIQKNPAEKIEKHLISFWIFRKP